MVIVATKYEYCVCLLRLTAPLSESSPFEPSQIGAYESNVGNDRS